jgi:DNA-binding transcriptional ArsR family regulator
MAGLLGTHPVNISRHLAVLVRAGLVEFEKRGVKTYPRLVRPGVLALLDEADALAKPAKRGPAKR